MRRQINVSLVYNFTFYSEDLGLDETAPRTALMDYADIKIDEVITNICNHTGLMPDEINTEVYEHKE
jgi:hypothetical protein